jgi:curved DNA-binding protein CbpA
MFKDYYALLGVERGATDLEIRSAYRRSVAEHHPDKASMRRPEEQEQAAAMVLELNQAMAVLRDPQRKAKYDYDLSFIPQRDQPAGLDLSLAPLETPVAESTPPPVVNSPPPPPPALDREVRAHHWRMRLETLPLEFTDLKWPGWMWSLKAAGSPPLVLAHRHVDTLNPAFAQTLEKSLARAMEQESGFRRANMIVLLTCGKLFEPKRVVQELEQITAKDRGWFGKKPMLILYDEAAKRGVRIGQAPEHDLLPQIIKILLAP